MFQETYVLCFHKKKLCFKKAIEKQTDKVRKESNMEQWDGKKIKQNLDQCIPQALNHLPTAMLKWKWSRSVMPKSLGPRGL